MDTDTIAAIATPAGVGSIGIVRLSGPDAFAIARRLFQGPDIQAGRIVHGRLRAPNGEMVDEVVLLPYAAPHSYTGEDVVEFCCHGGVTCPPAALRLCLQVGARMAGPGEFTQRAFLNGKLDLAQAEAVCDLINATAEAQRRLATRQLEGELSRAVRSIADRITAVIAAAEAAVDFAEEVGELDAQQALDGLTQAHAAIQELRAGYRQGRMIRDGVVVAIVGLPNVGKSSLLNALLGTERAIVTDIPGTTRDTIEDRILLDGVPITLWDTAGLREATDPVEQIGVRRTEEAIERADYLLLVLSPDDWRDPANTRLARVQGVGRTLVVLNQIDRGLIEEVESTFPDVISVSALTGAGLDRLRLALRERILGGAPLDSALVSRERHLTALEEAQTSIEAARRTLEEDMPSDLVTIHLREALDALGLITGETVTADLVERIFADFCVGK
ncbi:MAG: tRNA uridine-5-carboxymethylaminomethyl(34) synthesis GTPase MnmE [Fimbriimonadia bacterium]|jgi:tRNA modification GTPase